MKRSRFSEEQVAYALRQVEAGTPVGDVCRQLAVSETTFYTWKKEYAHLGVSFAFTVRRRGIPLFTSLRRDLAGFTDPHMPRCIAREQVAAAAR